MRFRAFRDALERKLPSKARFLAAYALPLLLVLILSSALSLRSLVGLAWVPILLVHGAAGAVLLWAAVKPATWLNSLVGRAAANAGKGGSREPVGRRRIAGIGRRAIRSGLKASFIGVASVELFLLKALLSSAVNTSLIVPHVVVMSGILLSPFLLRTLRSLREIRGTGPKVLAFVHILIAASLAVSCFYHLGVRDFLFPASCFSGEAVRRGVSSGRYGLVCEEGKNRCAWIESWGFATPKVVSLDLGSRSSRQLDLPTNPVRLLKGPDGLLYAGGFSEGGKTGDVGSITALDPDTLSVVREIWLPHGAYWTEIEPRTGTFFVTDLLREPAKGISVYDQEGNVLNRIQRHSDDHLAVVKQGIAVVGGGEVVILDPRGNEIARKQLGVVIDAAYDEARDRLYVVGPLGRLTILDATSLETLDSFWIPFGSRYTYLDRAHDILFIGNPLLPSITAVPLTHPRNLAIVTDVPIGVRAFSVVGERLYYTSRCGLYSLGLSGFFSAAPPP